MTKKNIVISAEMLDFKESIRHIWNMHFSVLQGQNPVNLFDQYADIERSLFWAIVLAPLGIDMSPEEYRVKPLDSIELEVKPFFNEIPIKIGTKESNGNVTWSESILFSSNEAQSFKFFDFFDWQPYGFVDYPYLRFCLHSFPQNRALEGKWGLIETQYVDFIYLDQNASLDKL